MRARPRRRPTTALGALAVALGLLVGPACGGTPPAPTTTGPPGYQVLSDAPFGFAVAVPSGWIRIPLSTDPDVFDSKANALRSEHPGLAEAIVLARIIANASGQLMAAAPDGGASVNLTAAKAPEKDLDDASRKIIAAHLQNGATEPVAARLTVAGEPALRLTFKAPVETDEGTVTTEEVQFIFLREGSAYILTVMNAGPEVADAIAASLRLR